MFLTYYITSLFFLFFFVFFIIIMIEVGINKVDFPEVRLFLYVDNEEFMIPERLWERNVVGGGDI